MKNYPTGKELKSLRETLRKDPAGMAALLARTNEAYAELEKSGIRTSVDARFTKQCLECYLNEGPYKEGEEQGIKDPEIATMVVERRMAIQAFISKLG